jgi:hypothetical protein
LVAFSGDAMKIRPILLDSRPEYFGSRGRRASLLLAPLGTHTLIEHLRVWLEPLTREAPIVVAGGSDIDFQYSNWIRAHCPEASVATTADEIADVLVAHELSDAFLLIDPKCLPRRADEYSSLLRQYLTEPRVTHHLVAFESAVAGTKERVSLDGAGRVRKILRHYEPATWPFIAGVSATIQPVAAGILADGALPNSLGDLRQILTARGIPSRDIPLNGGALDLTEERGLLAASDSFVRRSSAQRAGAGSVPGAPLYIGSGHSVHDTARISGPVVIHPSDLALTSRREQSLPMLSSGPSVQCRARPRYAIVCGSTVLENCVQDQTDRRTRSGSLG